VSFVPFVLSLFRGLFVNIPAMETEFRDHDSYHTFFDEVLPGVLKSVAQPYNCRIPAFAPAASNSLSSVASGNPSRFASSM
jgi:hypothetical protein